MNNIVSIMCVTYNRLNLTQRMLDSLFKTTQHPFRLIFIDNGSTDGTQDFLRNLSSPNTFCQSKDVFLNETNKGIAVGRNQALKIANRYKDNWLTTVDNDVELPHNWLNDSLDILSVNPKFVIGVNLEGTEYQFINKNGKMFQYKKSGNIGTACATFHRALHEQIGYFTTEYEKYGEEDADFFFRARLVGWSMGYIMTSGLHLGCAWIDSSENENYRKFKDSCREKNLKKFMKNCVDYQRKRKNLFIDYIDSEI